MEMIISPNRGIGPILFNMKRLEIHKILNLPFTEFKKTQNSTTVTDEFDSLDIHVYYDNEGKCEAIEGFKFSNWIFCEKKIFEIPLNDLVIWLKSIDPLSESDDVSIISYKYGISIYSSLGIAATESTLDSVTIFRKGYFD